ncbi:hypothetical protein COCHEDRAFT_1227903 [Bipolaris maydis C5]|uniref:SprT-like domain-containing protein n=2 Tax=Cochliobolus heterostrophus TaxID=5016 RepID=M2SNJ4_COCH5|nr:hypothetical protein COCHEDRAFT_1227903 [Bipolaris maydis C5]KAH7559883.1 hypothetical protein BM1_03517 [Bipolaris maydis]KAJ5021140.1 hypothetical protein J3E73DRAFT_241655 [Bipolaris maydis]KAJ6204206.1 hypothetical protein PSV09DRAFT_1227903 [Bipolaris maydis]KAJ6265873.1 hypothetical protein PSV08DRAFT_232353 [Bipolaris maydis]
MGNPPVSDTSANNPTVKRKRRRLHPLRRIAKLILGNPKTPSTREQIRDHEQGKACHGPSKWHYLLPFLEPLISLDPKLSFIEDRILGRPPQPKTETEPSEAPRNLDELRRDVQEADVPCECDECAPKLYKITTTKSHGIIKDQLANINRSRRSKGLLYENQPKQVSPGSYLRLRFRGDYEAMTLVRHHMAWLDATYLHPSAHITPAVHQLRSLLKAWHPQITGLDMRRTLSVAQLTTLFTHLNRVFFSGCVPTHNATLTAGFSYLPEQQRDCFGKSLFNPLIGTQILVHPTLYRGAGTPSHHPDILRLNNRLGTIIHEMCHAFLKAYSCRSCSMHEACDGATGHGRAWQLLAKKLEEAACVVLGGEVDMGRGPSLLREIACSGRLPSCHDLEAYGMNVVQAPAPVACVEKKEKWTVRLAG